MTTDRFAAYQVHESADGVRGKVAELALRDLSPGEVVVRVAYSSINYKDALGATGTGKILRRFPLIAGIDLAGTVESSQDERFRQGQEVLVTGCGIGETHDGGYSQLARVPADWVVPLPEGLSARDAMIYGTAGFTAALAIHRMEVNDQTPGKGPIVVTGASGGVGSLAVAMLHKRGFEVIAVSGKVDMKGYLKALGASQVLAPSELEMGRRPLESARFGGAIDNVGGDILSGLVRHINLWGNIACVGLAAGATFEATVMPMILRGVSLLGISSTNCPMDLRRVLWGRLATDLRPDRLERFLTGTVGLYELDAVFRQMLDRRTHGRIIVDVNR